MKSKFCSSCTEIHTGTRCCFLLLWLCFSAQATNKTTLIAPISPRYLPGIVIGLVELKRKISFQILIGFTCTTIQVATCTPTSKQRAPNPNIIFCALPPIPRTCTIHRWIATTQHLQVGYVGHTHAYDNLFEYRRYMLYLCYIAAVLPHSNDDTTQPHASTTTTGS